MKIKDGFITKEVAGTHFVIPVGGTGFDAYMTLNSTGVFLFELLRDGSDVRSLTDALCAEFDVAPQTAAADVEKFVASLKEAGVLDE